MKLTQYQIDALTVLRAKLDVRDPGHTSVGEAREGLEAARHYLDSWVLPLLDVISGLDAWHREAIGRQAARIVLARREAEAAKLAAHPHVTEG